MIKSIYLNFNGELEEAFDFYKKVFKGEIKEMKKYSEMPHADSLSIEDRNKVMNGSIDIGNGSLLMGCDILESWGQNITMGSNFYVNIAPNTEEEARIIFGKLSSGGEIYMPLQKTFWGAFFGSLKDKYGVQWMININ